MVVIRRSVLQPGARSVLVEVERISDRRAEVLGVASGKRAERLAMCAVEHRRLTVARIRGPSRFARYRGPGAGTVHGRGRNKDTLGGHGIEEALLVEPDAVLTPPLRRSFVARAANLDRKKSA